MKDNKEASALGEGEQKGDAKAKKGTEKKEAKTGMLKFSYSGELTGEIDGPTVTASTTTDNSWDFSDARPKFRIEPRSRNTRSSW